MNTDIYGPLVNSVTVRRDQATAFDLWVRRPSTWWPVKGHSKFGEAVTAVVIEPHVDGRIYERSIHGETRDWGRITAWDPPRSMSFTWHIYGEPEDATDVEVTFEDTGQGETKVTLVHSGWERLGDRAVALRRANITGWTTVLNAFSSAANGDQRNR